jgi:alpha-tubulin suppressor-like RCC1 family protein
MSVSPEISNNNAFSNKLKVYFKDNIKLTLKTPKKLFIITKDDIFYEIFIYEQKIPSYVLSGDQSILDSMIVKELCYKRIIDLNYGSRYYIARTIDNRVYIWGYNKFGQLGNGKRDEELRVDNKPEFNDFLSQLDISFIRSGCYHSMVLTKSGKVYAWGYNKFGQIGIGSSDESILRPTEVQGFDKKGVIMISCGYWHSMALTESGRVFSWGDNDFGQLGLGNREDLKTPKLIELNEVFIEKISCGKNHSLMLSENGVIYAFGDNSFRQVWNKNKEYFIKPLKLKLKQRFIDIASNFLLNTSFAISEEGILYVWGQTKQNNSALIMTKFESFNQVLFNCFGYNLEISQNFIDFEDPFFRNGYFEEKFIKNKELGRGSYGQVFESLEKEDKDCYAIKKIKSNRTIENEILQEFLRYSVIYKIKSEFLVQYYDAWFEYSTKADGIERLNLFILMELCDFTLKDVIKSLNSDEKTKNGQILTEIGYYIASELFIEILECVDFLHKQNIIHRDLKPENILLKNEPKSNRFIKIADFGFVAIHEFAEQSHTIDKGTPKYMAPEVINSKKYDLKADIYSLGIVLKNLIDLDIYR